MTMKKTLLIIVLITSTFSAFAQRHERINALKVAFITEKLEFTSSEAEKFWPVYNSFETEKQSLRKQIKTLRKGIDFETLTDNQANTLIQKMLDFETKKHQLHTKQAADLLNVIPAKKVVLLKIVEEQFNKRMLEEIKNRRQNFKNKNNH